MLRIWTQNNEEVLPVENIYSVIESVKYTIEYKSEIISEVICVEDYQIDPEKFIIDKENGVIRTKAPLALFEFYFGLSSFIINAEKYIVNVLVNKMSVDNVEDMLLYLWDREDQVFNNILSKSSVKLDFDDNGKHVDSGSKFLDHIYFFLESMAKITNEFRTKPRSKIVKSHNLKKFKDAKLSRDSYTWFTKNINKYVWSDRLCIDPNSVKIGNKYVVVNNIMSCDNIRSYDNYENGIILLSFLVVKNKLAFLRDSIRKTVDIHSVKERDLYDFRDMKKLAFLQLDQKAMRCEKMNRDLYKVYSNLFKGAKMIKSIPRMTRVFSQIPHYREAYHLIIKLFQNKFDLGGELQIMNLRNINELYEVFNHCTISDILHSILNLDKFKINYDIDKDVRSKRSILFSSDIARIRFFYEANITTSSKSGLFRLEGNKPYKPDHLIEIEMVKDGNKSFYILDSKYSSLRTVKKFYLSNCQKKYILDIGVFGEPYKKIDGLVLLYPGKYGTEYVVGSKFYKPRISIIESFPNNCVDLRQEIKCFLGEYLNSDYLSYKS